MTPPNKPERRAFSVRFDRPGRSGALLTLTGDELSLTPDDGPEERRGFGDIPVAMLAFEAHVRAFEEDGFTAVARCEPDLPGVLADIGCDDDRSSVVFAEGQVRATEVYEADPVSVYDDLSGRCKDAEAFGRFDPATALVGGVLPVHALRRLFAHPAGRLCPRVGLTLDGPWVDGVLDFVVSAARAEQVTHLVLGGLWNVRAGQPFSRERALGEVFPRLCALTVPGWSLPRWSQAPWPHLDRLRLDPGGLTTPGRPDPVPLGLTVALNLVGRTAPSLRSLALPYRAWDREALEELFLHPVLRELSVLDLFRVHHAMDFDALLAQHARWQHLEHLVLGSHLVTPEIVARFAGYPNVVFANYLRAGAQDLDRDWRERVLPL